MRSGERGRARFGPRRRAVLIAVVLLVSAALCCARPLGYANFVSNSVAGNVLLCVPFLLGYALGYEAGVTAGLAAVALLLAALYVVNGGGFSPVPEMLVIGPWIAGRIVGSRRRLADQLRARNAELLAQREAYAAEAVRYERSRIAADLHDIVGHALSLMVVQASAGQRVARGGNAGHRAREANARKALESVAEAAREAQAEVGLLAGLLSGPQAPGDEAARDQAPAAQAGAAASADAGLDLVAGLVRQAQAAGLEVTYRLVSGGDSDSGGGDVDATSAEVAGRIVTEALTNALKHAPGAPVTVEVRAGGGGLTVTIENGAARNAGDDLARPDGGYGLPGLRDRVLAHGGRFDAGPAGNGGWRIHAVLPAEDHLFEMFGFSGTIVPEKANIYLILVDI
jgi:signal transduction histidine kinase